MDGCSTIDIGVVDVGAGQARRRADMAPRRAVRATFDAAQTTAENRNHWAAADALDADAAANPSVRATIRNRARYEVANNSYARGIGLTLANDVIGTGPRLQLLGGNKTANKVIEDAFAAWALAIDLPGKLRTMRLARFQDGEAFGLLITNPALPSQVLLDIRLIEADQVASPGLLLASTNSVDGIVFDDHGNPVFYEVLKSHPGATSTGLLSGAADKVRAELVLHWYRVDRPGQSRGLPDIMPALPLFAQLRRYTLAVLGAAESAADVALFMKTNLPADGTAVEVDPLVEMEIQKRMAVFAPEGWEATQVKAEQPVTTYGDFKGQVINEIARCLNMPFNVAAGNSASYNYASGRLDHQVYFKARDVERADLNAKVLDRRIWPAWVREFALVTGTRLDAATPHRWFWDGTEHVDPTKEASADDVRLGNGTLTEATYFANRGKDWQEEEAQRAGELGVSVAEFRRLKREKLFGSPKAGVAQSPKPDPDSKDKEPGDEDEA